SDGASTNRRRWRKRSRGRGTSCASRRRSTRSRACSMPEDGPYRYRPDVLTQLWRHGVQPTARTPPSLVRDSVRGPYKYEIRRLRERYVRGAFPKQEYWVRVDTLRRQYPVLALRAEDWILPS